MKKVNIEIPKKDYVIIKVSILEDGKKVRLSDNDLIFFSVKRNANRNVYAIQKTLGNGISFNQETMQYEIEITSNDTANMFENTDYGYDITIYYDGNKPKQKVIGKFRLSDKYTLNEVSQ